MYAKMIVHTLRLPSRSVFFCHARTTRPTPLLEQLHWRKGRLCDLPLTFSSSTPALGTSKTISVRLRVVSVHVALSCLLQFATDFVRLTRLIHRTIVSVQWNFPCLRNFTTWDRLANSCLKLLGDNLFIQIACSAAASRLAI